MPRNAKSDYIETVKKINDFISNYEDIYRV